ncbi:D-ribose-binding periplasmic protein precursor [Anatilimnocola aggregata]|uniref:D-ribose-binding periplasmic protein n=1 Tax=Anatilimnocola aggregata TaxID=2528021 RepID=A0A517YGM4_9BACT|nr:substrate-binding domain-containing protein [Anatilimnocola aggregata]QDU29380.1 D-ribose-binding periplasmic protein precursor [Anatilimnocola aggregata]
MTVRRLSAFLSFLCLGILACGGCSPAAVEPSGPSEPLIETGKVPINEKRPIGISVLTLNNPFFKVIADSVTADLAKEGYTTIVVAGELDVAKQQSQIEDFIAKGCSAIVLCPCDSKAIGPAIQKANTAGIPVFTADIACLAPQAKVVSHIATDNYGGGKQAGEAMIEALGGTGGKVVILDFKQAESCLLRVKGFKEVIAAYNEKNPDRKIDIVAELPGDGKRENGNKAAEDALQAHPDLVGIFAINDPSALGAYVALEKANKTAQVKIIGFDGQDDGKRAIRDGKIYADPIQYPERMGQLTAKSILEYFDGKSPPAEQLIPTELYRQADGQKDESLSK